MFLEIKDRIKNGEFGNIYSIEGDYLWGRFEKLNGWRANLENYSLSLGAAIHLVDLVMWLVDQKPSRVFALGNKLGASQTKLRKNSFVSILMEFPSELVVKISAHGGCTHPHYHLLSVFGEKLTALHRLGDPVWISSCDASIAPARITSEYPAKNQYKNIICSFVESIVNRDINALVSAQEVFDATSVCMAVDDSIKRQEPIIVDYVG